MMMTSRYRMFEPIVITSTRNNHGMEWMGLSGRINPLILNSAVPDLNERQVYMCGPGPFMDGMKGLLKEDCNFDLSNLHMESFGGLRTSKKNKGKPAPESEKTPISAAPPIPVAPEAPPAAVVAEPPAEANLVLEFVRSGKTVKTDGETPILEVAEDNDIDIEYSCRSGSCGECKVRLLSGEVDMEEDDGLEPEEKAEGYILTCVGMPKGHCKVDA
jgi:ferredoxin